MKLTLVLVLILSILNQSQQENIQYITPAKSDFDKQETCQTTCQVNNNCQEGTLCDQVMTEIFKTEDFLDQYPHESCKKISEIRKANNKDWRSYVHNFEECLESLALDFHYDTEIQETLKCSQKCSEQLKSDFLQKAEYCETHQNCYANINNCQQQFEINNDCSYLQCLTDFEEQEEEFNAPECDKVSDLEDSLEDQFQTVSQEYIVSSIKCLESLKEQYKNSQQIMNYFNHLETCYLDAQNNLDL